MTDKDLLRQALMGDYPQLIAAVRRYLAQPAPEPVAYIAHNGESRNLCWHNPGGEKTPLYATPPAIDGHGGNLDEAFDAPDPYLCIAPACGDDCHGCSCAISPQEMRDYAIGYAILRNAPLGAIKSGGVFAGRTPDNVVINGADLDAATFGTAAQPAPAPVVPAWLPIESAPKDDYILLWCPTYFKKGRAAMPFTGRYMSNVPWIIVNADMAIQKVHPTHWMPLPAAPGSAPAVPESAMGNPIPPMKPLTDEQIESCSRAAHKACDGNRMARWSIEFVRAIEAAHGIGRAA